MVACYFPSCLLLGQFYFFRLHFSRFLTLVHTQIISLVIGLFFLVITWFYPCEDKLTWVYLWVNEDKLSRHSEKKIETLNDLLGKPQLFISCLEILLLSSIGALLLIKDKNALHQWKLKRKYQKMRKWEIFQHGVFKAATLKWTLTTPTDSKKFKAVDNNL